MYSFGYFPGVRLWFADVSEPSISSIFILYIQPLKMELIEGSETSANHNRTPGKYPKEYIQENNRLPLPGIESRNAQPIVQ